MASAWRPQEAMRGWVGPPQPCGPCWLGEGVMLARARSLALSRCHSTQGPAWPGGGIPVWTRKMCFEIMQSKRTTKPPFCFILALVLWPSLWRMLFLRKQELLLPNPKDALAPISMRDPGGETEGKGSTLLQRAPSTQERTSPCPQLPPPPCPG